MQDKKSVKKSTKKVNSEATKEKMTNDQLELEKFKDEVIALTKKYKVTEYLIVARRNDGLLQVVEACNLILGKVIDHLYKKCDGLVDMMLASSFKGILSKFEGGK